MVWCLYIGLDYALATEKSGDGSANRLGFTLGFIQRLVLLAAHDY